jgi:TPR repeat protein
MNRLRPTLLLARRTLWTGALLTAFAVHAGPAEDVKAADTALRAGDLPTAMALLRKASDQDFPLAQARLGDLLRAAEFETEAVVLYKKAVDKGEPAGEVGLGRAYADGAGVKQDSAAALELYRKAEQKNYGPAYDALARAYRTGTLGLAKDLEKAKAYEAKSQAWQKTQTAEAR